MTDETIESFRWVFHEFVKLMGGKEPMTILTDQCRAMEVAIQEEWKNTTHRWCKWHVLKRVRECLGSTYIADQDFRDKFHKMLNEMLTIDEFEKQWSELLTEYGLQANPFLEQIYATRTKWVKSYFKGVFCARMTSTQRSECQYDVEEYCASNSTLHKFVEQHVKLQFIRDQDEDIQEKRAKKVPKNPWVGGPLVCHAREVYTPNVFHEFVKIKDKSEYYYCTSDVDGRSYVVEHYEIERIKRWWKGRYVVKLKDDGIGMECECGLVEHFGLTCCHIIRVLIWKNVQRIPEVFIMKRWTKKARIVLSGHLSCYNQENPSQRAHTFRHTSLMIAALDYVNLGDRNVDTYKIALQYLAEGKRAMEAANTERDGLGLADQAEDDVAEVEHDAGDEFVLRAPKRRKERGGLQTQEIRQDTKLHLINVSIAVCAKAQTTIKLDAQIGELFR